MTMQIMIMLAVAEKQLKEIAASLVVTLIEEQQPSQSSLEYFQVLAAQLPKGSEADRLARKVLRSAGPAQFDNLAALLMELRPRTPSLLLQAYIALKSDQLTDPVFKTLAGIAATMPTDTRVGVDITSTIQLVPASKNLALQVLTSALANYQFMLETDVYGLPYTKSLLSDLIAAAKRILNDEDRPAFESLICALTAAELITDDDTVLGCVSCAIRALGRKQYQEALDQIVKAYSWCVNQAPCLDPQ